MTIRQGPTALTFSILVLASILIGCATSEKAPAKSLFDEPVAAKWADESRLIVALMGDPQLVMTPETPGHVSAAMADLATLKHDFLAVLGDLVQNREELYEDYLNAVVRKSTRPVFSLAGNGDLGAGLGAYLEATALPLYYRVYRRGIRFIFVSTVSMTGESKHICGIGDEQCEWLEKELAADTESTTVVFSHAPVFETTWHSEDRSAQPYPGSMYLEESVEMRRLFSRYPNIKVFAHGHLHHSYPAKDEYDRGAYHKEGNVLHISVGAAANGQGGSFLFIDDKKIVVRVRDNAKQAWRDDFTLVYPVETTFKR
jgi:Calcineurin-like phosphoesterase